MEIFKKYPHPDIIAASPLCQSFSCVLNMKGGGTCFWKLNEDKSLLVERSVEEFERLKNGFTKRLDAETQLFIKRLGERCINNVVELINYYQPKLWYIENPKQSLMWKYLELNKKEFVQSWKAIKNEASYGKYGFLTTKATYFLSNIPIYLLKGKIEPPYTIEIIDGQKYYVLKDDKSVKVKRDLDSRMIGISSIQKMIKARKVKSGMGAMDFIQRQKTPVQKNKMSNEQICEAGPASAIPHSLILDIFNTFKMKLDAEDTHLIRLSAENSLDSSNDQTLKPSGHHKNKGRQ